MFNKLKNKSNKQIVKFKKNIYNISTPEQILNIFKFNIDLCSQQSKKQMLQILQGRMNMNTNIVNYDELVENIGYYNIFLSNYNQRQSSFDRVHFLKTLPTIYKENGLIVFQGRFLKISSIVQQNEGQILFKKTFRKNNKKGLYFKIDYQYDGQQDLYLSLYMNNNKVYDEKLIKNNQFGIIQQEYDVQGIQIIDFNVEIYGQNNLNQIIKIKNIQINLL